MNPKVPKQIEGQGSFLPSDKDVASGALEPTEPGVPAFFPADQIVGLVKTEKIARLSFEYQALDQLATENQENGNLQRLNGVLNETEGAFGIEPELESPKVQGLKAAIKKSEQAEEDAGLWSKRYFAASIGVAVKLITRPKQRADGSVVQRPNEKHPVNEPVIITEDPEQQEEFDKAYKAFRDTYFGTEKYPVLDQRRKKIAEYLDEEKGSLTVERNQRILTDVQRILQKRR